MPTLHVRLMRHRGRTTMRYRSSIGAGVLALGAAAAGAQVKVIG